LLRIPQAERTVTIALRQPDAKEADIGGPHSTAFAIVDDGRKRYEVGRSF
jgi:hypothetical protein